MLVLFDMKKKKDFGASQTANETLVPFQSTSKDLDFPLRHEVERPDKRT